MRILPWSLSVPAPTEPFLVVPRLPFPYLLRSVLLEFGIGLASASATVAIVDGAGGLVFWSTSEVWPGAANPAIVNFAPGHVRSSSSVDAGSGGYLPPGGVWTLFGGVNIYVCQGALPPDCWVMPSMQLKLFSTSLAGAIGAPMSAARLIIGVP